MDFYNDFIPYSSKAWKQKIQFDLQGKDYIKTLVSQTNEGVSILPFYHFDRFEKLEEVSTNNTTSFWCKKIEITNENDANELARKFVNKKCKSFIFRVKKVFNYKILFQNLLQKNIVFHFDFSFLDSKFIGELQSFLVDEKVFFTIDCIKKLVTTGNWYFHFKEDFSIVKNQLSQCKENHFLLGVSADVYQNAGANASQQIAYALAHANEYLTLLNPNNLKAICFHFAMDTQYFVEIAKLKAFRYLWKLILKEYNADIKAVVLSKPSFRNTAIHPKFYDFKNEISYSSSVLGKSDFVIVNNEQLIQQNTDKNSELSFYIESIAKQLAEKALLIFKTIEKGGGFLQQLKKGTIQQKIKENHLKEQLQLRDKIKVLSKFYNSEKQGGSVFYNPVKTHIQPLIIQPLQ